MNWLSVFWGYCGLSAFLKTGLVDTHVPLILEGQLKYVNTSSVPHCDWGDEESGHFIFLSDTNPLFFLLSSPLVILVWPYLPWQAKMLCWEMPPDWYSYHFWEMFPAQAVISQLSVRECNWRSFPFPVTCKIGLKRIVCPRIADPRPRHAFPESMCAINIRTMASFSNSPVTGLTVKDGVVYCEEFSCECVCHIWHFRSTHAM